MSTAPTTSILRAATPSFGRAVASGHLRAKMRIALGIVDLFAAGGLQRDCLAIGALLRRRGHDVSVFVARCESVPAGAEGVVRLPCHAQTNHGRDARFGAALMHATRDAFDVVVGFNKLPGLDVLYCADPSIVAADAPAWKRWLPRYRTRLRLEACCFAASSPTRIMLLSEAARAQYLAAWPVSAPRIAVLPPSIAADRVRPDLRTAAARVQVRGGLGRGERDVVWLWVGAQPQTKGLDRVVAALAGITGVHLWIAGVGCGDAKARGSLRLARRLGVASRIDWLGPREDIPALMAAADLLVHPARQETTGQVILEALAVGLPVVTTAVCGFAEHVARADAGVVLAPRFDADRLAAALASAGDAALRASWSQRAIAYVAAHDVTGGFEQAAEFIEQVAGEHARRT